MRLDTIARAPSRFIGGLFKTLHDIRPIVGDISPVHLKDPNLSPLELFDLDQLANASKGYLQGGKVFIGEGWKATALPIRSAQAAKVRKRFLGAVGGIMAADALGIDPLGATSLAKGVLAAGVHGIIGSSLVRAGGALRMLGIGYLGLGAYNTLKPGDNLGPM